MFLVMVYGLVCASVFFASSQLRRSGAAAWCVSASRLALLFLTLQFIPCLLSLAKLIDQEFGCVCGVLQVEPGYLSSYRIKKIEASWFKSLSHGVFLNASTTCLVK
jgi:hypothetical protein